MRPDSTLIIWDADRDKRLRALWDEGLSCAIIADRFGDCTRNSVIGRCHRLGLKRHDHPNTTRRNTPKPVAPPPPPSVRTDLWPAERVARLRKMHAEGLSFSEMAAKLGDGLTRNAVLARAHRMGLRRGAELNKATRALGGPRLVQKPKVSAITGGIMHGSSEPMPPVLPPPKAAAFRPLPGTTPVLWEHRTNLQCCWPIDDENGYPAHACGHRIPEGGRWCLVHMQLGHVPPKTNSAKRLERLVRRYAA